MSSNAKERGILRIFVYYDGKEKEFVGVCVDLGIVKNGDNPYLVEQDVVEASMGYVEAICEKGLPDKLLNQKPPEEYLKVFEQFERMMAKGVTARKTQNFDDARLVIKTVPNSCLAT